MSLHWFPEGLKMGQKGYQEVFESMVKPWVDAN